MIYEKTYFKDNKFGKKSYIWQVYWKIKYLKNIFLQLYIEKLNLIN